MGFVVNDKGTLIKVEGEKQSEIIIPSNTLRIGKGLFSNNGELQEVVISSSLKVIGEQAFLSCPNLKTINLSNVEQILKGAFKNCKSLDNVTLPRSLAIIGEEAFLGCNNIKKIEIPSSVKKIDKGAFYNCKLLNNVTLNNGLEEIGEKAFESCGELETVKFPITLFSINNQAFAECRNLENIQFSPLTRTIGEKAFYNCVSLRKVILPSKLVTLKKGAFERCFNLETVELPESLKEIEAGAFLACNNLKKIIIKNYSHIFTGGLASLSGYEYYLDKETDEIIMSKDTFLDSDRYRYLDYKYVCDNCNIDNRFQAVLIAAMFTKEDLMSREISSISYLLENLAKEDINKDNYNKISFNLHNSQEFNNLIKHIKKDFEIHDLDNSNYLVMKMIRDSKLYDIFKLSYALGMFNPNKIERQKASEFVKNLFDKNVLTSDNLRKILNDMNFSQYDKEIAEFLMNKGNFEGLVNHNNILSKVYNNFENIKEFSRSNKGKQEYRKVTLGICIDYCNRVDFDGVNLSNSDVATTIAKFTVNQETFNNAKGIRDEYLNLRSEGKIRDHLLDEELKETDITRLIENERKVILENVGDTLDNLNQIANNKFTFEFLSKYDPDNFVLGKYCSCCAHLESAGYGVVKASILHPDCQNLVIRNDKGKIIAKSTLYVNRAQGYGLFNNVEINNRLSDEDKIKVYEKYIEAINEFAAQYNKKYPSNPLTQINVGMTNNKLESILRENKENADNLLEGINFTLYGRINQNHSGDWQNEQRVIWKNKESGKKGDNNDGR